MRLLAFLRGLLPRFFPPPPVRWEDGVAVSDPRYARLYAEVVQRICAVRPAAVQSPEFHLTVRLYERWPKGFETNWGKILPPNLIAGDAGGTLCLRASMRDYDDLIRHESAHAITGIPDHPAWLFVSATDLRLNV